MITKKIDQAISRFETDIEILMSKIAEVKDYPLPITAKNGYNIAVKYTSEIQGKPDYVLRSYKVTYNDIILFRGRFFFSARKDTYDFEIIGFPKHIW